jgi:hypothetical protein
MIPGKVRAMYAAEKFVNAFVKRLGLRVIFIQDSALHSTNIKWRGDGLITSQHVNFQDDPVFKSVIAGIRKQVTHSVYHEFRIYNAVCFAGLASKVKDSVFVECGVGEAILTNTILEYYERLDKRIENKFYLVDTYSGVDPKHLSQTEIEDYKKRLSIPASVKMTAEEVAQKKLGSYQDSAFEKVQARLAKFPNVQLVKGSIPDVFADLQDLKNISYLHIDLNNALPEGASLKFFYDRMSTPGFILLDDYGFPEATEQRNFIDATCRDLGIAVPMSLPSGQGLLIKTSERSPIH